MLDKAVRELDRENFQIEQQEKKLKTEIKKAAKENQMVRRGPYGAREHAVATHNRVAQVLAPTTKYGT